MLICAAGPRPATMRLALSGTQGLRSDRHRYRLRWPRTTKVSTSPAPAPLIIALGLVQSRQPPTAPTSNLHSARRNPPRIPSRSFLHWRLSDAGPKPRCSPRRPSLAGIRNPSQLRTQCSQATYSMTSSICADRDGEIDRPSASAVLLLTITWNFDGCSTGRLAGIAPLMILST